MGLLSIFSATPSSIGGLEVDAILEEIHTDTLRITEHPVEKGAAITDHSYKEPVELVMRCGWSQSSVAAIVGAVRNAVTPRNTYDTGVTSSNYIGGVYADLLSMQSQRLLLDVVSSRRLYQNMIITSLSCTTDEHTSNILDITCNLRGVRIVETQSTALPDTGTRKDPSQGSAVNAGTKQAVPKAA